LSVTGIRSIPGILSSGGKPILETLGIEGESQPINSLLKKASEHAIAHAIKNSSSPKANKKRDCMSQRTSK
jgi:hypothetical protein